MGKQNVRIEVVGLNNALRHLRGYDKEMYKTITGKMRTSAQPLATQVGGDFPERVLTNWKDKKAAKPRKSGKPFPTYSASAARGGVKPKISAGRARGGQFNIVRIQQMTAGGAVLDAAGSRTSNIFVKNLDLYAPTRGTSRKGVSRSRVMYGAVQKRIPQVQDVVAQAIKISEKSVQQAINAGSGR